MGHQGPVQGDTSPLGGAGSGLGWWGWRWLCRQCLTIGFFPPLVLSEGLFCNRTFDMYACWPDGSPGTTINISCPFYLPWFEKGDDDPLPPQSWKLRGAGGEEALRVSPPACCRVGGKSDPRAELG